MPTDISTGDLFWCSGRGCSHVTLWFHVHSNWIQTYHCSSVLSDDEVLPANNCRTLFWQLIRLCFVSHFSCEETCYNKDQDNETPVGKFLKHSPLCAEAVFDIKIDSNGQDEDSKDLLITFDLTPFGKGDDKDSKEREEADDMTMLTNMVQKWVELRS